MNNPYRARPAHKRKYQCALLYQEEQHALDIGQREILASCPREAARGYVQLAMKTAPCCDYSGNGCAGTLAIEMRDDDGNESEVEIRHITEDGKRMRAEVIQADLDTDMTAFEEGGMVFCDLLEAITSRRAS